MSEPIALAQAELDKILHNIRKDNAEHGHVPQPSDLLLSQDDLDSLLGDGAASTLVVKPIEPPQPAIEPNSNTMTDAEKEAARAAKIAERKARAAEMLARVNANSPKRLSVLYGSTLRKGNELSALQPGDAIQLDREIDAPAAILVDGKPFGRGVLERNDGKASVKIIEIFEK